MTVVLLLPATVFAQATLTGTVRDASGGVLPGVTVEAASPALIEKTRSAVTDASGQYRIIDLRPGTYSLTYTLPGFNAVKRDGIELTGTSVITIPIEMRVGGIEETITVSGETPVVDVQSPRRETVIKSEVIDSLPVTRAAGAILNITPGIVTAEVTAGALAPTMTAFNARSSVINAGSVAGEGRYAMNGFPVTAARSGGFASIVYDTVNVDEINITVGGGLGESDIGGPVMNIIPRSGANTFGGTAFVNTAGEWSSGSNINGQITALNPTITQAAGVKSAYDWSASYGGPIKRDRMWFYGSYRDLSTIVPRPGIVNNLNAGNPARWDWMPGTDTAQNVKDRTMWIGRVTAQLGKNRLRGSTEYQARCEGTPLSTDTKGCHNRGSDWVGLGVAGNNGQSPEATSTAADGYFDVPYYLSQFSWTMPATNKLLFEAGYTPFRYQPIFGHPAPDADLNLIAVTEQSNALRCNPDGTPIGRAVGCTPENAATLRWAPVTNFRYRGVPQWGPAKGNTDDVMTSLSYVTGAHSAKIGYQLRRLDLLDKDQASNTQLEYRFNQGVPNAVGYYMPDFGRRTITNTNSVFMQDTWTHERLTLQGALRWDRASSYAPVALNGTTNTSFLNLQPITIQRTEGVNAYNDITPRFGAAYDLFGNGQTALKFNYGKYLAYAANDAPYTSTNPGATIVRSVQGVNLRPWTDSNNDYVVNCDLLNPAANDECGVANSTAANFGKATAATIVDPDVLSGWGVRPGDTQYTFTIQQQIVPRVSADFAVTHRKFHGFFITDNINRHAGGTIDGSVLGAYETYTINAPRDNRLPGGGGYPITVYNATAAAIAVPATNYMRLESAFGDERDSHWDGFEYNVNARLRGGLTVSAGASTGRGVVNTCATVQKYAGTNGTNISGLNAVNGPDTRSCNNVEPWQTTIRGLGTYTLPKVDVLISATVRSAPPQEITAIWQVNTLQTIAPLLGGRVPAGSAATTNIVLTDSDHRIYADNRRTTVDMRFAKILRFGGRRADVGVDLNNALNTNYATAYNGTFIQGTDVENVVRPSGFLAPTSIYNPRFVRFNITLNF
ncbi:MAG TPA: TonB-dependent receptor [Vicinamibacterales bacterium]|nr:TonB-dependent receptor [Vicinamibacterales bacterium]